MISVSDEFVKSNGLKVQIKNQNLIPFPSDYGVGGQSKHHHSNPKIGDMVLNNVQALVTSSKGNFGTKSEQGYAPWIGKPWMLRIPYLQVLEPSLCSIIGRKCS